MLEKDYLQFQGREGIKISFRFSILTVLPESLKLKRHSCSAFLTGKDVHKASGLQVMSPYSITITFLEKRYLRKVFGLAFRMCPKNNVKLDHM